MTSQMTLANANGVGLRTSEAPFAAADGYAAWWTAAWQRKLDVLRSVQHVDNVCGIRWGESYRTHHNAIRSKAMKRRELAKERMRHTLRVSDETERARDGWTRGGRDRAPSHRSNRLFCRRLDASKNLPKRC